MARFSSVTSENSLRSTYALYRRAFTAAVAVCVALVCAFAFLESAQALDTVNQKQAAFVATKGKVSFVNNKGFGKYIVSGKDKFPMECKEAHVHETLRGNTQATLRTFVYLPISYLGSGTMGAPQSVNLTPDGHYAYVTYPQKNVKSCKTGRIVRYDMWRLAELGINTQNMDAFVLASRYYDPNNTADADEGPTRTAARSNELYKQLMECMVVGPWCEIGHGNAFAYNPADGHLWFIGKTGASKTNLQRINMDTLTPDLKIKFNMGKGKYINNNLTFDNQGRCYFYSYSNKKIRIYQGKIKNNKRVSFKLIPQGIKNSPTPHKIQAMGYNPASNRLYMVANSVIMSVPVDKLGKLKKSDVQTTVFNCNREFEGVSFDNAGNGYALVIRWPELMSVTGL